MIEVPCACGASLRFGASVCSACGLAVDENRRAELERRATGAYSAYRDARNDTDHCRIAILMIGLVYCAVGVFVFAFSGADYIPEDPQMRLGRVANLAINEAIGAALLVAWFAARRAPSVGFPAALVVFVGAQLALAVRFGPLVASGGVVVGLFKVVAVMWLVRGVLAVFRLGRETEKLEREQATEGARR